MISNHVVHYNKRCVSEFKRKRPYQNWRRNTYPGFSEEICYHCTCLSHLHFGKWNRSCGWTCTYQHSSFSHRLLLQRSVTVRWSIHGNLDVTLVLVFCRRSSAWHETKQQDLDEKYKNCTIIEPNYIWLKLRSFKWFYNIYIQLPCFFYSLITFNTIDRIFPHLQAST